MRWVEARSLPVQLLLVGGLAAAATAALGAWAAVWLSPGMAAAAAAVLASVACAAWARRTSRGLNELAAAARQLVRPEAPDDAQLPLDRGCAEMAHLSLRLRRHVEHVRQQRLEWRARNAALGRSLDARTNELSTLQDLSAGLVATTDQTRLMDEALRALERTLEYGSASIWARDRRGDHRAVLLMAYRSADIDPQEMAARQLRGSRLSRPNLERFEQIERERRPIIDNDVRQGLLSWLWNMVTDDAGTSRLYRATRAWMGLPLSYGEEVLGVMRVDHAEPGYFTDERARLLSAVCNQTGLALRHAQLLERERDVAVAAERNRIARDLHDAVSQTLFAAQLLAGTLVQASLSVPGPHGEHLAEQAQALQRLNQGALAEMRLLMFELRPDALEHVPLPELLRQAVDGLRARGQLEVDATIEGHDLDVPQQRVHVWRISQEALSNLVRHSRARHAAVTWQVHLGRATLRISDDGCGFDPEQSVPGHFGLHNMRARAAEIGAQFDLRSAPGDGTELVLALDAQGSR